MKSIDREVLSRRTTAGAFLVVTRHRILKVLQSYKPFSFLLVALILGRIGVPIRVPRLALCISFGLLPLEATRYS